MSLTPPDTVRKLQETLHAKAKRAPTYRFYALYDKVYRADVLSHAYTCCAANDGAAGVDGQTFADIEAYGAARWVGELAEELRNKRYRPQAVRRVYIPKADGKQRPLGIPTIRDRVVQMAALLVLEPIFEADLQPEQYAYRQGRSALDAIVQVQALLDDGPREVVDADLSGYFDSIPHAELLKAVARRLSDSQVLALIKSWLVAPVEEYGDRGDKRRTTRNKDEGRGTPQGGVLSPLLVNLYRRRVRVELEGTRARTASRRAPCQLCRRLRDLLSRDRRRGGRGHAEPDVTATADGERDQNAGLQLAGRAFHVSGLHLRA